jgi:hypothetical protein
MFISLKGIWSGEECIYYLVQDKSCNSAGIVGGEEDRHKALIFR